MSLPTTSMPRASQAPSRDALVGVLAKGAVVRGSHLNSEVTEVCAAQGGKRPGVRTRCQPSFLLLRTQVGLAATPRATGAAEQASRALLSSALHGGQRCSPYRNVASKPQDPRVWSKPTHSQALPDPPLAADPCPGMLSKPWAMIH